MRYTLFILGITLGFIACKNSVASKPESEIETATESAPPVAEPDSVGTFEALDTALSFAGIWVNEGYVNDLHITQSPRLCRADSISCIEIPARTLMVTRYISGFHDGAQDMVVVKNGNQYLFTAPDLSKKNVDTIQVLSPTRIRIRNTYLYKLGKGDVKKSDWGILEELLFSGTYHFENGKKVIFGENDTIIGLDLFTRYTPVIDGLAEEVENDVDFIDFETSTNTRETYGYKFFMDTLTIYKTKCLQRNARTKACTFETYGEKVFTLIKEK
ncbi:hypothetical protein [Chitinophaga silvisoli]|uniref:Uncharacterized protein n=1 Tax=Chitinophaga silvisoli TaxID=2291814 RepID=A0A3E1P1P5_9BACT|nr:hypothetical protein [Chitinophaga silvisoli]RFM34101.1 hypothetical protein DXN04_12480 [Chitinophaga silvisoli]